MHIAIVGLHDPDNPRSWSGSVHHMIAALRRRHRVSWLGPLAGAAKRRHLLIKVKRRLARTWLRDRVTVTEHDLPLARALARAFDRRADELAPDVLFSPAGSIGLPYMESRLPAIYLSDATFALMEGYYPEFARLAAANRRAGAELERLAIARADESVFASDWASASAVRDYGADPAHVTTIPFGANLAAIPDPATLKYTRDDRLRLVLIGIDWIRKGVDIAVDALAALRAMGLPASLTVVGCTPPPGRAPLPEGVTVIPFLDKKVPEEAARFQALLRESDFHLLPTRFEAIGVAFCEAAAYAMPSAATDTGGVASHVEEGVNGFRLPPEAGGEAYARRIAEIWNDPAAFEQLRRSSRAKYDRDLNWNAWADRFEGVLRRATEKSP